MCTTVKGRCFLWHPQVCVAAKQLLQEHGEAEELVLDSSVENLSVKALSLDDGALPLHLVERQQGGTRGKPSLPPIKRGHGQQRSYLIHGGGLSI